MCDEQSTGSPLLMALKAGSLDRPRDDSDFLDAFRLSATTKTGGFPPAALVELYHEPGAEAARLRRLHLIIVDLCHPRKNATRVEKHFHRQLATVRDTQAVGTTPIPLGREEAWRYRYSFGYSLDDSDKPVFLIWPERTEQNGFWLLDVETGYYHDLCQCPSIENLGLEHFYAAFGLGCSRNLRNSLATALRIGAHTFSEDCSVPMDVATQLQPLQHGLPCETQAKKRAKTAAHGVNIQPNAEEEVDSSPNGSDSETSSSSQTASTVDAKDVDTDLEDLEDHYYSPLRRFSATLERCRPAKKQYTQQELFGQTWDFHKGRDGLQRFLTLPPTWPLARLMFPIRNLKKQMETLLQAYCFETAVTCAKAESQGSYIKRMAMHLGQYMAIYLAETITGLLERVITHPGRGLVNETNATLLTPKFWVQAIYTELLLASSRFRAVREKEQQRPPNGLVKVVCLPYDGAAEKKHGRIIKGH